MPKTVKTAKTVQTKFSNFERAKEALRVIKRTRPRQAKTYEALMDKAYQSFLDACVNFARE
jgi:hypothetical protein